MAFLGILTILAIALLKSTCEGQSLDRPPFIALTLDTVDLINENTWKNHSLLRRSNDSSWFRSVDFHYKKQMIFVGIQEYEPSFGHRGRIIAMQLKSGTLTEYKTIAITGYRPRVAVDWINDKLYWKSKEIRKGFTRKGVIHVANLDGSESSILYVAEVSSPFDNFQIDPINRKAYFLSKTSGMNDVLQQIDLDKKEPPKTIDRCPELRSMAYCRYNFAIDNAGNGTVYWMERSGSTLKSVSSDATKPKSYDFGAYEFIDDYNRTTINFRFENAHKGSLYATRGVWTEKVVARMIPESTTIKNLSPLEMYRFRIFHESAQP